MAIRRLLPFRRTIASVAAAALTVPSASGLLVALTALPARRPA
jgi:hypothetical protein